MLDNTFQTIDMDAHVVEPDDLWEKYIVQGFRTQCPRVVEDNWGMKRFMVESKLYPQPEGKGRAPRLSMGSNEVIQSQQRLDLARSATGRLSVMDKTGVDRALLLPSQGFLTGSIADTNLATACAHAYNNWLSDYCSENPTRLMAAGIIALQDPVMAAMEIERIHKLGFAGVYVRPNPVAGRNLFDPAYNPIFTKLSELGMPLLVHEGCGFAPGATVGVDRYENGLFSHAISHPMEMMLASLSLICGGVLERFPELKVAFLEGGCGWLPFWLHRLDSHVDLLGWEVPWMKMSPTEYFQRQCVISCDPDESYTDWVLQAAGEQGVVMITDFPHADYDDKLHVTEFPCVRKLTEAQTRAVLGENAARFLGMSF